MQTNNCLKIKYILPVVLFFIGILAYAQLNVQSLSLLKNDSLTLDDIISEVIKNHPAIKQAEESVHKADAQIGLAKAGYLPDVNGSINASHVGPVPELSVPDFGTFQLFPENNLSAAVNVDQSIYDFGRTASNVKFANESKELQEKSLDATKQQMALNVIRNYYALVYLQQALNIKDEQLKTLQEHLNHVKKLKATGSGTDYEVLSTQVKISGVECQKLDLVAAHDKQLAILNSLLGMPSKTPHLIKENFKAGSEANKGDSLILFAMTHRDETQIAQKRIDLASLHLDVVKTKNRPSVDFIASGGFKNGYVPDINAIKGNYVVGLGVRIPIFDANRSKYDVMIAQSSVQSSSLESELVQRNVASEVVENESKLEFAAQKVNQTQLQLLQAKEAYKLAQVNYTSGAITNLELLDAETNLSESELMSLKARIDYAISAYFLDASLGNRLY